MKFVLIPRINKTNKQINISIKKKDLPKDIRDKLPKLKEIILDKEDFYFG
jgi:hypothetical protein